MTAATVSITPRAYATCIGSANGVACSRSRTSVAVQMVSPPSATLKAENIARPATCGCPQTVFPHTMRPLTGCRSDADRAFTLRGTSPSTVSCPATSRESCETRTTSAPFARQTSPADIKSTTTITAVREESRAVGACADSFATAAISGSGHSATQRPDLSEPLGTWRAKRGQKTPGGPHEQRGPHTLVTSVPNQPRAQCSLIKKGK